MKIKTSELTGAALDWAVAQCEGKKLEGGMASFIELHSYGLLNYSTEPRLAQAIIEREHISVAWMPMKSEWMAGVTMATNMEFKWIGQATEPLVAAMRCYVVSKRGGLIAIPDELLESAVVA